MRTTASVRLALSALAHVPAEKRERFVERLAGEEPPSMRMREMNPEALALVMSGIQENVRRAAAVAALAGRLMWVLPFPGRPESGYLRANHGANPRRLFSGRRTA